MSLRTSGSKDSPKNGATRPRLDVLERALELHAQAAAQLASGLEELRAEIHRVSIQSCGSTDGASTSKAFESHDSEDVKMHPAFDTEATLLASPAACHTNLPGTITIGRARSPAPPPSPAASQRTSMKSHGPRLTTKDGSSPSHHCPVEFHAICATGSDQFLHVCSDVKKEVAKKGLFAQGRTGTFSAGSHHKFMSPMFPDAEELKERIREHLLVPGTDMTSYYRKTGVCQSIVRHPAFEHLSLFALSVSSIWVSIDIDMNESESLADAKPLFQVVANVICVFFVAEFLLRVMAFERKLDILKEKWLVFDLFLVILIIFDTWVVTVLVAMVGTLSSSNLRIMVVFRALRLLRVLRVARVVRQLPELLVIVRGMVYAARAILVVLTLLAVIIYVAAIIFRLVLKDTALGSAHFSSVMHSMGTLLLEGTLSGSKGAKLLTAAHQENPIYSALIFVFVLVANITMMGILVGLLVQTVKTVAECEKEEKVIQNVQHQMEHLWMLITEQVEDHPGMIKECELKALLGNKDIAIVLSSMGVDLEGLVDVCGFIFEQHGGTLSKTEFKRMVLDLRGNNMATVRDHVETRKFVHAFHKKRRAALAVSGQSG